MIHKTAIVDSKAKVSNSVKIGAYSIIGPNVKIGNNTGIWFGAILRGDNEPIYIDDKIGSSRMIKAIYYFLKVKKEANLYLILGFVRSTKLS